MRKKLTGYDVGALLYCPANAHTSIADALVAQRFPTPFSLAFCLEDTVRAEAVPEAEALLETTLGRIAAAAEDHTFFLPPVFVRVRSPEHLLRLAERYAPFSGILAGFILPKLFTENCARCVAAIRSISRTASYSSTVSSTASPWAGCSGEKRQWAGIWQTRRHLAFRGMDVPPLF